MKMVTKEDVENSDWTSCCKGPILKKELQDNLWVCPSCNKHHRISCRQRFDIIFGKNNYEILKTPIPQDDPLKWVDSKPYKERLKAARKKTGQDSAIMIIKTKINNIDVTVGAFDFAFIGGSVGAAEGEAIIYGVQHAIDNKQPFILFTASGGMRMFESLIALSQMTRVTLAINELKKNNLPYLVCITDPTAGAELHRTARRCIRDGLGVWRRGADLDQHARPHFRCGQRRASAGCDESTAYPDYRYQRAAGGLHQ